MTRQATRPNIVYFFVDDTDFLPPDTILTEDDLARVPPDSAGTDEDYFVTIHDDYLATGFRDVDGAGRDP